MLVICGLLVCVVGCRVGLYLWERDRSGRIAELYEYWYDNSRKPSDGYYGKGPPLPPDDYSHV